MRDCGAPFLPPLPLLRSVWQTALAKAAYQGDVAKAREAIEDGADVNGRRLSALGVRERNDSMQGWGKGQG